jgi:hypothetical protein
MQQMSFIVNAAASGAGALTASMGTSGIRILAFCCTRDCSHLGLAHVIAFLYFALSVAIFAGQIYTKSKGYSWFITLAPLELMVFIWMSSKCGGKRALKFTTRAIILINLLVFAAGSHFLFVFQSNPVGTDALWWSMGWIAVGLSMYTALSQREEEVAAALGVDLDSLAHARVRRNAHSFTYVGVSALAILHGVPQSQHFAQYEAGAKRMMAQLAETYNIDVPTETAARCEKVEEDEHIERNLL